MKLLNLSKVLLNLFAFISALAVSGCNYNDSKSSAAPAAATGPAVSIVVNAATMHAMAYSPNPLSVSAGATVTWTNTDSRNHTVTSDTGVFDSGQMAPGQTFTFTFPTAGSFPYHCNVHPSMTGSVTVM